MGSYTIINKGHVCETPPSPYAGEYWGWVEFTDGAVVRCDECEAEWVLVEWEWVPLG